MRRSGKGRYPRLLSAATAFILLAGVSQRTRSTPEVRLPAFSVTRLTASALPLNEQVRRRCKAPTLPHLPARVAFTIRAWSRRTTRSAARQSMACQPAAPRGTAPAGVAAAVICPVPCGGSPCSLVIPDPVEVRPLSRGVMSQPLSRLLRPGVRFLHHPLPAAPSARLAARFPSREDYGLTVFRTTDRMDGVGPLFSPVRAVRFWA